MKENVLKLTYAKADATGLKSIKFSCGEREFYPLFPYHILNPLRQCMTAWLGHIVAAAYVFLTSFFQKPIFFPHFDHFFHTYVWTTGVTIIFWKWVIRVVRKDFKFLFNFFVCYWYSDTWPCQLVWKELKDFIFISLNLWLNKYDFVSCCVLPVF